MLCSLGIFEKFAKRCPLTPLDVPLYILSLLKLSNRFVLELECLIIYLTTLKGD